MTIEEIRAAMEAILSAIDAEESGGDPVPQEELDRYEELEVQLATAQRKAAIRSKEQAFSMPVLPKGLGHVSATKEDDTLDRAFNSYLRTGVVNQDLAELRAQSEASGGEGGYLVPDKFRQKLVDRMVAFGGIAAVADSFTTGDGNPVNYPTVDDTGNVGEIVAEGGTFSSGADITFGQRQLGAYRYMAGGGSSVPLRVSVELLQDNAYDVEGIVTRKLGQRIGRIQAQHLVRGTGVNEPEGLVTGLTGIEPADDTAGITYSDLLTFIHSVDPAYREMGNCRWAFNDQSLKTIRDIKDSNGDPIWRPDTANMATNAEGGSSGTLLGYPVTIDQGFVDIDIDDNTDNWGVFGDIREGFVIRRVRDVVIIVNPWTRASNGQVEYTAWARMDAAQQDRNAYVALTGETP